MRRSSIIAGLDTLCCASFPRQGGRSDRRIAPRPRPRAPRRAGRRAWRRRLPYPHGNPRRLDGRVRVRRRAQPPRADRARAGADHRGSADLAGRSGAAGASAPACRPSRRCNRRGARGDDPPDLPVRRRPARRERHEGAARTPGGGSMKAVRFRVDGGEPRLGRLESDHVVEAVRLLYPVVPQKILAVGLNYQTHVEETSLQRPDVPFCFAIFPSSLTGPYDEIVVPAEETRPDWEGEVAVLLGRRAYRADRAAARAAIGGIAALNDVSGRRAQLETPMRQFTLGKSFDTFTPLGPCVVHPDDLDLGAIALSTRIDGDLMQSSDTRHLIFGFEELIEYFSKGVTLEPGDVIATGTPGGVGDERKPPRYLREGEVVEVSVEGVGSLRNPVRFERL